MLSRRRFATTAAAAALAATLPRSAQAAVAGAPGGEWRRFEITTRLQLSEAAGPAQAWVPLPGFNDPNWVVAEGDRWTTSDNARAVRHTAGDAALLHVQWGEGARSATVISTLRTRDRPVSAPATLSEPERALYLRGTALAPTDGIVKDFADRITVGRTGDAEKARALYEWIVENTFRAAPVRGCGDGDVVRMLRSRTFGGKCADLNPLFVALARASGIPGRDLYGIRVAPSRLGYKSLGPSTATITKSQHCRAEVYLEGTGWTAMDPADVRKVMLEETQEGLPLGDPRVAAAQARLFGAWEGNWVPLNAAHDVALPGTDGRPLGFLMYPQVETAAGPLDCYDPEKVRYEITAQELSV